jgi:hypothetical protein
MNEGRERDQMSVSAAILGLDLARVADTAAYTVVDASGAVLFTSASIQELCLYLGSKREH